jgi:acyl dehydratase
MADVDPEPAYPESSIFEGLTIGETASLSHTVEQRDIDLSAAMTGDVNPAYAATDMVQHIILQGTCGARLISATLGMKLPGPGTIYLGQDLRFRRPVGIGDTITATVTVVEKKPTNRHVTLATVCTNQHGEEVITGSAFVRAPPGRLARSRA